MFKKKLTLLLTVVFFFITKNNFACKSYPNNEEKKHSKIEQIMEKLKITDPLQYNYRILIELQATERHEKNKESECKTFFIDFFNPKKRICKKMSFFNIWAFIDDIRHNCGFYLKKKVLKYGEWFLGSAIGIGWYPQFLNFHKNFRIGFFEVQYNFLSAITYFAKLIFINNYLSKKHLSLCCILIPLFCPINFSLINFQMFGGFIKLRFIDFFKTIYYFYFIIDEQKKTKNKALLKDTEKFLDRSMYFKNNEKENEDKTIFFSTRDIFSFRYVYVKKVKKEKRKKCLIINIIFPDVFLNLSSSKKKIFIKKF